MRYLIRVIDLETTGMAPPEHTICEFGICHLNFDDSPDANLRDMFPFGVKNLLAHPGRDIPPEASAIHHIRNKHVAGLPHWEKVLVPLTNPETRPDIYVAHNKKFEQQWLTPEVVGDLPWICTYKCGIRMWPEAPTHSNQGLRYFLKLDDEYPIDESFANRAHSAAPDAYVTSYILLKMLQEAPLGHLIDWSHAPVLLPKVKFGKHEGKKWTEIPRDYLDWILTKDFDEDVDYTARMEIERRRTENIPW